MQIKMQTKILKVFLMNEKKQVCLQSADRVVVGHHF